MRNEAVDATLEVRGGRAPYTWALAPGSWLPNGLTFDDQAGRITGTPTARGRQTISVEVTDADGIRATGSIQITIAEAASLRSVTRTHPRPPRPDPDEAGAVRCGVLATKRAGRRRCGCRRGRAS